MRSISSNAIVGGMNLKTLLQRRALIGKEVAPLQTEQHIRKVSQDLSSAIYQTQMSS